MYSAVLNFIYNTPNWRYYTSGGCYAFYLKLKARFPEAEGYYNMDHVITKIGDRYYDSTGEVEITNHLNINKYYDHTQMMRIFKTS